MRGISVSGNGQLDLFDAVASDDDQPLCSFVAPGEPRPKPGKDEKIFEVMPETEASRAANLAYGWIKRLPASQKPVMSEIATLVQIDRDGCQYEEAIFRLSPGYRIGQWPHARARAVVTPAGDLMQLYDAVERGIAVRVVQ